MALRVENQKGQYGIDEDLIESACSKVKSSSNRHKLFRYLSGRGGYGKPHDCFSSALLHVHSHAMLSLLLHHELNELVVYGFVSAQSVHNQYGGVDSQSILPSPSWSASLIISSTSSSVNFSPIEVMT